jgi:hypothetical protein
LNSRTQGLGRHNRYIQKKIVIYYLKWVFIKLEFNVQFVVTDLQYFPYSISRNTQNH